MCVWGGREGGREGGGRERGREGGRGERKRPVWEQSRGAECSVDQGRLRYVSVCVGRGREGVSEGGRE